MKKFSFEAVIFDLDGVITDTAIIHFKAWKEVFDEYLKQNEKNFKEFTKNDYFSYIDGKPRAEGVKSFLESRNIHLPLGLPNDSSLNETIWGIGNKKNEKYLEILRKEGVKIIPQTVQFIKKLKNSDIKIGVISSSKNCQEVLKLAGLNKIFNTRVDGKTLEKFGLKGKPNSDVFYLAAKNLKTIPGKCVVVEDAISGVQAGRNGGFGLVIGLASGKKKTDLFLAGADIVVKDLSQINLNWLEKWFSKKPEILSWQEKPSFSQFSNSKKIINPFYFRSFKTIFSKRNLVFFLDYDGTLTPIVARPELAIISPEMKNSLKELSKKYQIVIVSGRIRKEVEKMVGIEGIFYAGSHGMDIKGPKKSMIHPQAKSVIPIISKLVESLSERLGSIPGILIENKKYSFAVHYRLVAQKDFSKIKKEVDKIKKTYPELRLIAGKKVFEFLPAIDWNKGKAVLWIMEALDVNFENFEIIYIGDDVTDEDAFRVIGPRGTGILVAEEEKISFANFRVFSPNEVEQLFKKIL
ncbi:MAG TPA: trehalose-phosphatase [Candidatus Pacearchaeota archaeon]|nr:trehalose-phosphatase [Candidatus Pacearchaeota archaeon]HOK93943.1 trehalose-phosphatase [Candidatus Pacearchaeota archaeon]HPO75014.1 trehalose-phosphatase [Candidatus Pacearchaeota archaeon]